LAREKPGIAPVVSRTAKAEDDLVNIRLCIAQDDPDAADRILEDLDRR